MSETKTEWEIVEAIELARKIEATLESQGESTHVALGGGVLTKLGLRKDLDLFFYPHKSPRTFAEWVPAVEATLKGFGFTGFEFRDHSDYSDEKQVYRSTFDGRRVDLFFLQ
jgi:hypothetical protein